MRRALVVCPARPGRFDGVGDYSYWLACALCSYLPTYLLTTQNGAQEIFEAPPSFHVAPSPEVYSVKGWYELWQSRNTSPFLQNDVILLQYVPQLYFPARGAWWLLFWLAYARFRQRKKLVITVHEYDVPWSFSMRRIFARVMLNLLMGVLGALSRNFVVTYGDCQRKLSRLLFWRKKVCIIPVGSNVPCVFNGQKGQRETTLRGSHSGNSIHRAERDPRPTVLTIFGQPAGMDHRLLSSLGVWISGSHLPARIQWIGRSRQEILDTWSPQCGLSPDLLEVYEKQSPLMISQLLQTSDLFLAPLFDGVSTRRTTIMAALGHGLPVVGTNGPCTDSLLREAHAFLLSPCGDGEAFVRNVDLLVNDEPRRKLMGRAARDLHIRSFTWERIAGEYWRLLRA